MSFVDVTNIHIILTDNTDKLIDRLGPAKFSIIYFIIGTDKNVKKGHVEFWVKLQCCTAPYM